MDKKHVGNRASNYIRSKGRIVAVETCTSNGYYVQGIKGGHPFEKVPGIGHYNGYGAFKVYEKYQRSIYLVVCVYRDNGSCFSVQIDVKDAVMKHYGYKRYTHALLDKAVTDLKGKKIFVYYDDVDREWKLSYPAETLWYSRDEYLTYAHLKKTCPAGFVDTTSTKKTKKKFVVRLKKRGENKNGIDTRTV